MITAADERHEESKLFGTSQQYFILIIKRVCKNIQVWEWAVHGEREPARKHTPVPMVDGEDEMNKHCVSG